MLGRYKYGDGNYENQSYDQLNNPALDWEHGKLRDDVVRGRVSWHAVIRGDRRILVAGGICLVKDNQLF